jgi:hypothetical protein
MSAAREAGVVSGNHDLDEELPVLSFQGPGDYRLRIHARGRDTAVDLAHDQVMEWYLIQAWPARPNEVKVVRQTDHYGASVRGEKSTRSPNSTPGSTGGTRKEDDARRIRSRPRTLGEYFATE